MPINKMQYNASDILNYPANHHNPTTQTNYANNVKNWVETEKYLVDCLLWQPNTAYEAGSQVRLPSLGPKYFLVCTTTGTSGSSEPNCTDVSQGSNVTDGTAKWLVGENTFGQELSLSVVTYNATSVLTADNWGNSIKSGTVKVIGGHFVLFDAVINIGGRSDNPHWNEGLCAKLTNNTLRPAISTALSVAGLYNGLFATIEGLTSSYPGNIYLQMDHNFETGDYRFTGMYWI